MASSAAFWNRIAKFYSKRPVTDEAAYRKKLEVTREYFQPDMEVLEFGCGTGSTAIAQSPFVSHILAIDISPKMLEIAQGKAEKQGITNVTFNCATIDEFKSADERFDVAMGHSILHLLDDRNAVIQKVYRMLKPGGVFVTSTSCLGDLTPLIKYILPIGQFLGLLPLVRFFTDKELVASIEQAGFTIEHKWQPSKKQAVFIVALKPAR